jgi:hypothetical protein
MLRRKNQLLVVAVIAAAAVLLLSLPFARFSSKVVAAAYSYGPTAESECENEVLNQIILTQTVPYYVDANLTEQGPLVLEGGKKYLICGDPILPGTKALRIWIGGPGTVFVPIRSGVIVGRNDA